MLRDGRQTQVRGKHGREPGEARRLERVGKVSFYIEKSGASTIS